MTAALPLDWLPSESAEEATPPDPAQEALAAFLAAAEKEDGGSSLYDFIPRVSPHYKAPVHLDPLVRELERSRTEPVRVVCHAPPRHGKPLGKDTRVTMADGSLRPISSIVVGDRVVSGAGRPTTVTAVYEQGLLPVFRVTTRSGRSFLAEGSHRFLTQRGWLRVDELRQYDRNAWQRPRGDSLLVGAQYTTEPLTLQTEVARFLGYMAGDGNTTQRNCRWTNIDPIVRAEFSRVVVALGGDVVEHDTQTFGVRSGCNRLAQSGRAPRHHLKALLEEHGLNQKKAHGKVVPQAIFTAQREAVTAFLAALFECDGYRGVEPGESGSVAAFYSVSRALLDGCQALLARLGIRSSLYVKRGRYNGEEHLSWQLSIQDQARFFDVLPLVGSKAGPKGSSRRYERDGQLPDSVISVEPAGSEDCYCITVADDESFLAEGLITHNTETVLHAIAWYLKQDPRTVCGYATYGADLSYSKSRVARSLARSAGVDLAPDAQGVKEWRTRQGGGLLATGVGGPFTGFGVNHLFVDDPFKNRADAESSTKRQTLIDWWNDVASTRLEPGGSAIVFATRWHPEDLSGYLIEKGWRYIRLPAIDDSGAALWPERYGVADFASHRTNEYTWASLFQGLPRPRGGSVFNCTPATYTPEALAEILKKPGGFRRGIGVDLAYSRRTNADHSAAIAGLSVRIDGKPYLYILEVERAQLEARMFAKRGADLQRKHGGAPALWYAAGAEKGVADLLTGYGFKVGTKPATHDKFTRAQAYAAAWNDGRVLIPAGVGPDSWVNVFLAEHLSFTGSDDKEDDQVDAGAALYDLIAGAAPVVRGVATQPIGFF